MDKWEELREEVKMAIEEGINMGYEHATPDAVNHNIFNTFKHVDKMMDKIEIKYIKERE